MGNKTIHKIETSGTPKHNEEKHFFDGSEESVIVRAKEPNSQTITENFKSNESLVFTIIKKHNKEWEDSQLIEDCLMRHFFLRSLEKQARIEIIKQMSLCFIEKNKIIFNQGTPGNFFYILKEGTVELIIDGKHKKDINQGENFGELALLHGALRSGTVKTKTDCFFWVMERKNFRKIVDHITHITFEENKKFVNSIPILSSLGHTEKTILCNNLYKESFEEGTYIVKEGEQSSCLFFVKEGEVECINPKDNNKVIRTIKKGEYFGERSILIDSTRTLDVIAKTKCLIFSLSVSTLQTMLGENFRSHLYLNLVKNAFLKSKNFKKLNIKLFDQVFQLFTAENHEKEEIVYPEGYLCSSKISVLIDGCLINGKTKEIVGQRCGILFEDDILNNTNKKIDFPVIASPDCLIIEAETKSVLDIFQCTMKELIEKSVSIERLRKVNLFKNFSTGKLDLVSQKIKICLIKNGQNLITQGEEGTRFYIIKSGKVDIFVNNKYIRTMNENECLGERALFFQEPRSATAKANGDVEAFYLEKEDFTSTIETNMKEFLMNRLYLQDNTVQLSDLLFYDKLGSGNYGSVSLVKSKKNNFFYAIKNISTKQILFEQLHKNLELERSILLQIDHPFIVKLVKTLKDQKHVYFLMEYIKGKELFDIIREIGELSKYQTQFYAASMMLAVDYLHQRKFIFRDIKPENIMVLTNGYIKLIDFGTAKAITDRTMTTIGTPHYMAPEVILNDGYSFEVDFWSIGICMYEFMCGPVPFGEDAEDPMDVYLSIINE